MANWLKVVAAIALILAAGVAALVWFGVWPGPSAADRERSRSLFSEAADQSQKGNQDAALRSLDESIRLSPENDALRLRASIHMGRNNFDGALRDLDAVISRGGGYPALYSQRCWLRARAGELDGARSDCDRAIRLDPSIASAYGNRGLVGLRQQRFHEAWSDYNTALRVGGSDEWVAWRVFGRGVAAYSRGNVMDGRADIETALHANPGVAADYAQYGLGREIVREFDDATYASATNPRSLMSLQQYLIVYPQGAHVAEARAQMGEIYAGIAEDQANGRRRVPGFSLGQGRGSGSPADSFGAIALSRSSWRVAFVTDYATGAEAERAAASVCNRGGVGDCDAYRFRNVCAALAISPAERVRGMGWAYAQDDAVRTAILDCRERGGRSCAPVHSQCTPTPPADAASPVTSP